MLMGNCTLQYPSDDMLDIFHHLVLYLKRQPPTFDQEREDGKYSKHVSVKKHIILPNLIKFLISLFFSFVYYADDAPLMRMKECTPSFGMNSNYVGIGYCRIRGKSNVNLELFKNFPFCLLFITPFSAIGPRIPTPAPGFDPRWSHVDFLRVFRFPSPILIPPNAPYSSIIQGWDNSSISGRRTKCAQSHPTPRNHCRAASSTRHKLRHVV
jgi:hypothetical protein